MTALDGFKEVNDTLGHAAGDALLCHVAEQIRAVCTHSIMAAPLFGYVSGGPGKRPRQRSVRTFYTGIPWGGPEPAAL